MDEKRLSPEIEKRIEPVAEDVSRQVMMPILRSMMSRTEATELGNELYKSGARFGFQLAIEMKCTACSQLVLVGTDGCSTCEQGRVSVYTQGTQCLECKNDKAALPKERGEG
jgi:hypothetical protein